MFRTKKIKPVRYEEKNEIYIPRVCRNCGFEDAGNYCSRCGQSFGELKKPFRVIFTDLLSSLSLDSRIFRTIPVFLFQPGRITVEFLQGKRKKYMPPVRLYLFLSILFFFVVRYAADRQIDDIVQVRQNGQTVNVDTVLNQRGIIDITTDVGTDTEAETESRLGERISRVINDRELYVNNFLNNLSYALFLLMPLFALLLQILYIRRNRYYIEHLIFSLNIHSFALFLMSMIFFLRLLLSGNDTFLFTGIALIPVYLMVGLKRVYRQGIFKVLLKAILLSLIYGFFLFIILIALLFITLVWF
jgi:hypothetical protein